MDLEKIEKLMEAMGRRGISRLAIREKGLDLELEREGVCSSPMVTTAPPVAAAPATPAPAPAADEGKGVTSPMVGTFYSAPSPDDPPFIKVGDTVDENTVIGIVEAMKVMNEVKAGISGTVTEILVKNGDPVEFGTKIMRVS